MGGDGQGAGVARGWRRAPRHRLGPAGALALLVALSACVGYLGRPGDAEAPGDGDADADADTDVDTDTDADVDTDVDADADADSDVDADVDADTDADSDSDPATAGCPALPRPGGTLVEVGSAAALVDAVGSAAPGTVIVLADGTYALHEPLWLTTPDITLFGASGRCGAVVLDVSALWEAIVLGANGITLANLTVSGAQDVALHVQPAVSDVTVYNCAVLDSVNQLLKVSSFFDGRLSDDGLVACSHFEFRGYAPIEGHVNGISVHAVRRWVFRDNVIRGVRGPGGWGDVGPALLIWSDSSDVTVERNLFIDNSRSIALGNPFRNPGVDQHVVGAVVRNNFVVTSDPTNLVELYYAQGCVIAYNTVMATSGGGVVFDVGDASGRIAYNIANCELLGGGGGGLEAVGNVTSATGGWFVGLAAGDLHLGASAGASVIGAGSTMAEVPQDIDGDARGGSPDLGADQRGAGAAFPPASCRP